MTNKEKVEYLKSKSKRVETNFLANVFNYVQDQTDLGREINELIRGENNKLAKTEKPKK